MYLLSEFRCSFETDIADVNFLLFKFMLVLVYFMSCPDCYNYFKSYLDCFVKYLVFLFYSCTADHIKGVFKYRVIVSSQVIAACTRLYNVYTTLRLTQMYQEKSNTRFNTAKNKVSIFVLT